MKHQLRLQRLCGRVIKVARQDGGFESLRFYSKEASCIIGAGQTDSVTDQVLFFLPNLCLYSLLRLKLHSLAYFIEKSEVLHLLKGPKIKTHH